MKQNELQIMDYMENMPDDMNEEHEILFEHLQNIENFEKSYKNYLANKISFQQLKLEILGSATLVPTPEIT